MYKTELVCGHNFLSKGVPPIVGTVVYCRACVDYQFVGYRSSHWRVKCVDCRYSRYWGSDKEWARHKANQHAREHVGHRVKLFQANNPDHWDLIKWEQDALPISTSARSFLSSSVGSNMDNDDPPPF